MLSAYLGNTRGLSFDGEELVVGVPSQFVQESLEGRFRSMIQSQVDQILGGEGWRLKFEVDEVARKAEAERASAAKDSGGKDEKAAEESAAEKAMCRAHLNPRYTPETYLVGGSNRFAHAVGLAISANPGKVYNPTCYHGGVGVGKTHLMQAIGHEVVRRKPRLKVLYVTSEAFLNEYISAMVDKSFDRFRKKYRGLDLLLLDDVQFLGKKERLQEEFFHTYNELYEAGKQIVMTSDRPPQDLDNLEERLTSRFQSGTVVEIRPPDFEMRMALLKDKARREGVSIPDEAIELMAERVSRNIRELEGALTQVMALASVNQVEITRELVEESLRGRQAMAKAPRITLELIKLEVCEHFGIELEELQGKRRDRRFVGPRQVAMFLGRQLCDATLSEVAQSFGKKDHTTVLHACGKVEKALDDGAALGDAVRVLRARIKEKTS